MSDYRKQYQTLNNYIDQNNKELIKLRKDLGLAQKNYFNLRTQNESLES